MNSFLQFSELWMNIFLVHMLEISLFILLIWLADKFIKLTTWSRYLLWILALTKIFFPPIISFPSSIQGTVSEQVFLLPIISNTPVLEHQSTQISFSFILLGIWVVWAFALAIFIFIKNIKFKKSLIDAVALDALNQSKLNPQSIALPTLISSKVKSPVIFGIWEPKLYLPSEWQNWSHNQLNSILAHERAHFHKRDILVLIFQHLAVVLFGLNPFVWLVHKRINHVRELHCDEMAIQQSGIKPVEYSKIIYTFIEKQVQQPDLILIGKSFFNNDQTIFERIHHVLNFEEAKMKAKSIWEIILAIFLAVIILPFSWECGEKDSDTMSKSDSELGIVKSKTTISEEKTEMFVPYDEPPKPVGGFTAIQKNLKYPVIARKAGIEGRVVAQLLVSEEGKILDSKILKSLGHSGCDEAAVDALKSVKWQPAMKNGTPVEVWITVPVVFKLNGNKVTKPSGEPKAYYFEMDKSEVMGEYGKYDDPPEPIGGFTAIQKNLKYPVIARKAGIEGRVVAQLLVSEEGKILDSKILKSLGHSGCDEAAVDALKSVKWQPAMKDGKPVKVWVAVPVVFKLK